MRPHIRMTVTRRWVVTGRVQGVGFRAFIVARARQEGVGGFVRNLADGGLETVATGAAEAMSRVEQALGEGPPLARVEGIVAENAEPVGLPSTLTVRRSDMCG